MVAFESAFATKATDFQFDQSWHQWYSIRFSEKISFHYSSVLNNISGNFAIVILVDLRGTIFVVP